MSKELRNVVRSISKHNASKRREAYGVDLEVNVWPRAQQRHTRREKRTVDVEVQRMEPKGAAAAIAAA